MQTVCFHWPRVAAADTERRTGRADGAPEPAVAAGGAAKGLSCIEYLPPLLDFYFSASIKRCNADLKVHAM